MKTKEKHKIKIFANSNCQISMVSMIHYLKYHVKIDENEMMHELHEYCDWVRSEYANRIEFLEKSLSKEELYYMEYCENFFEAMCDTMEFGMNMSFCDESE